MTKIERDFEHSKKRMCYQIGEIAKNITKMFAISGKRIYAFGQPPYAIPNEETILKVFDGLIDELTYKEGKNHYIVEDVPTGISIEIIFLNEVPEIGKINFEQTILMEHELCHYNKLLNNV